MGLDKLFIWAACLLIFSGSVISLPIVGNIFGGKSDSDSDSGNSKGILGGLFGGSGNSDSDSDGSAGFFGRLLGIKGEDPADGWEGVEDAAIPEDLERPPPKQSGILYSIATFPDLLRVIPFAGPTIKSFFDKTGHELLLPEWWVNTFISRLFGGSLPCKFSVADHVQCAGLSDRGLDDTTTELEGWIPDQVIPLPFYKEAFHIVIHLLTGPVADILFGGSPKPDASGPLSFLNPFNFFG